MNIISNNLLDERPKNTHILCPFSGYDQMKCWIFEHFFLFRTSANHVLYNLLQTLYKGCLCIIMNRDVKLCPWPLRLSNSELPNFKNVSIWLCCFFSFDMYMYWTNKRKVMKIFFSHNVLEEKINDWLYNGLAKVNDVNVGVCIILQRDSNLKYSHSVFFSAYLTF